MAAVVVALVYHFFLVLASRLGTVDLVSDVLSALYFAQGHSDFEYFPCSAMPLS